MEKPPLPDDEQARLRSLHDCLLLDSEPEERFDRLTRLVKRLFNVKITLVSLVDADRQWFKSRQGLDVCETGRDISFCGHAILQDAVFCVPDASCDSRFSDNPLVTGAPAIRFYAGAPLRTRDGKHIGTLCIIDDAPREFSLGDRTLLREFADCVEQEIEDGRMRNEYHALIAFSQISALSHATTEEALSGALALACRYLKLDSASLRRADPTQIISRVTLSGEDDSANETRYAAQTVQRGEALAVASDTLWKHGGGCVYRYIGAPVIINGSILGVLGFFAAKPASSQAFTTTQLEFVRMVAAWMGHIMRRAGFD